MKKKMLAMVLVALLMMFPLQVLGADKNIVQTAVDNGSFTTLVAALQKAELDAALAGPGPFTVFAPTDAAFTKLLTELNISATDLLNHPQLKDVLLYHVVSGKVMSTNLSEGLQASTLNGEKVTFSLQNGATVNKSKITAVDIEATNGVIHVIDTVLVPASFKLNAQVPIPKTEDRGLLPYALVLITALAGITIISRRIGASD
jgi:uncharacterized surface protein with fasciclin (FAS1) repeats